MAKRKRRQKPARNEPAPATKKAPRRRWGIVAGGVIIVVSLAVLSIVGSHRQAVAPHPLVTREASNPPTPPSKAAQQPTRRQSQLMLKEGSQLTHDEQGFLEWEMEEIDLPSGQKRVEGTVRWNEKSGAKGEPVRGMPVLFVAANGKNQELTTIDRMRTDEMGQFTFTGDGSLDTAVIGKFQQAANLPQLVVTELKRKNRSPEERQRIDKLTQIQKLLNTQTAWGQKVSHWMAAQQTEVFVDYNTPFPAWYDPATDRILVNPSRALPREQQLAELRRGYPHNAIILFHEELHRAQNRLSGKKGANPEMALLREIHAYWLSHLLSVDALYGHIYENPHTDYANLYRIDTQRFGRLCAMIDWLTAYFEGDLDELAAYVGNAESIASFEEQTNALIAVTQADRPILQARVDQMWREKQQWRATTQRLAQEVLSR